MGENAHSGVSELVGAILLVALVITAVAIVAVVVLSSPPPAERPHVSALASNTTDKVMVTHNGGDELREEKTTVLLNGNTVDHGRIFLRREDGTVETRPWSETRTPWSVGRTLVIDSPAVPESLTVVYRGPSAQSIVLQASFISGITTVAITPTPPPTTPTTMPTTVPPTTIPPTTPPTPPPPPPPACGIISGTKYDDVNGNGKRDPGEPGLEGWTIEVYRNDGNRMVLVATAVTGPGGEYTVSGLPYDPAQQYAVGEIVKGGWIQTYPRSIYHDVVLNPSHCYEKGVDFGNTRMSGGIVSATLNTQRGGFVRNGGELKFTVTGRYSYVVIDGDEYELYEKDRITLTVHGDSTGVEIDMNKNWISKFAFPDVSVYRNGNLLGRGEIRKIWISEYRDMVSSLSILVPASPRPVWTRFVFGGTTIIDGQDGRQIELFNLYPRASDGFMRLDVKKDNVYYDGAAAYYQIS